MGKRLQLAIGILILIGLQLAALQVAYADLDQRSQCTGMFGCQTRIYLSFRRALN